MNHNSLLEALCKYDEESRPARADRIDWASSFQKHQGIIAGELVQLDLMEEARVCFVNGQFLAVVVCATSALEHLLSAVMKKRFEYPGNATFGPLIGMVDDCELLPESLTQKLNHLNDLRNPITHHKNPQDPKTLVYRFRQNNIHPNKVKEDDARFALELMYEVFYFLLEPKI